MFDLQIIYEVLCFHNYGPSGHNDGYKDKKLKLACFIQYGQLSALLWPDYASLHIAVG